MSIAVREGVCVLHLFIVATGNPYERRLQKTVSNFKFLEEVQDTEDPFDSSVPGSFKCPMYSIDTLDLGLKSHPKDC